MGYKPITVITYFDAYIVSYLASESSLSWLLCSFMCSLVFKKFFTFWYKMIHFMIL